MEILKEFGISIKEFEVTMKALGATRLLDSPSSRYNYILVPCFVVKGVSFIHSGTNYIVQLYNENTDKIVKNVIAALGKNCPDSFQSYDGNIYSIKDLIALVSILNGNYSTEFVNNLTNTVYKKILDREALKNPNVIDIGDNLSPKMNQLCQVLRRYDLILQPFSNKELKLKDPINYLDKVYIHSDITSDTTHISLVTNKAAMHYSNDINGCFLHNNFLVERNGKTTYLSVGHSLHNGLDMRRIGNTVFFNYDVGNLGNNFSTSHSDDFNLRINIERGITWKIYEETRKVHPVTNEQIDLFIHHLEIAMQSVESDIISNMVI